MVKKTRVDKTEYMKRIFIIQGWIIESVQSALIIRQILNLNWCTSQRHAERMLKDARDLWTKIPEAKLEQKRALKVSELQQMKKNLSDEYKKTPAGIRTLLAIEKEIILLEGLRKPTKVELTGENGNPIQTESSKTILYLPTNGRESKEV